jgi:hypothetical protein
MRMRMRMPRILLLHDHYKNLRLHQEGSRALTLSFVPYPEEEQWLWWCQLKASCIMLMLCPVQGAVKWSMTNAPLAASDDAFFFYLWYYCCQGGECKLLQRELLQLQQQTAKSEEQEQERMTRDKADGTESEWTINLTWGLGG